MFGLGTGELVALLVIFILLFGSKKIPELAKGLGQSVGEFKKGIKEDSEKDDKKIT